MPYDQVRFIGYTINTMPQENPDGSETYLGLTTGSPPATSPEDIRARCALMLRAMRTAAAALPAPAPGPAPSILNVFMAPEFFFRGPMGAYQMSECQQAIEQLQAMVQGEEWRDWLFAFGSILAVSAPPAGSPAPREAYNFSLVQLGGQGSGGGIGANVVMKELQAGCDFINTVQVPASALVGNVAYPDAGPDGPGREQQQLAYDNAGVFTQAGITWGLEICLDHFSNVQRTGRLQRSPQMPGDPQIQVQLVPSGGMEIHIDQIMAMPGGYVFNCDGADIPSATLKKIDLSGKARVVSPSTQRDVPDGTLGSLGSPPAPITIDQLYVGGPGSVVIYPSALLPAPATVPGESRDIVWPAADDLTLTFRLVFDTAGQLVTATVIIDSDIVHTAGRAYFMPLFLTRETDDPAQNVHFHISLEKGIAGYDYGIECQIATPQFKFEGFAVAFDAPANPAAKPDQTAW